MKIILKSLFFGAAIFVVSHSQASESNNTYSTFEQYTSSMNDKGLKLTLMVGCGHGKYYTDGDHTHPDSWCVNVKTDPQRKGFSGNTEESFKQNVQYDEILNISMHQVSSRSKETREFLPLRDTMPSNKVAQNIIGYKNTFDVVVLERPLPVTLNKPWTLWNAVHILKVGGELIIDSTDGYDSRLYVSDNRFMLDGLCPQSGGNQRYPMNQNPEKLERFGIPVEENIPFNQDMLGISDYLSFWGLTDIINVGDRYNARRSAYQPYTRIPGKGLETARRTSILSATKTQETEDRMEDWAKKIQSVRGHVTM